jgi:hypothetical protein
MDKDTSDLLELLRSKHIPEECSYLSKRSTECLQRDMVSMTNKRNLVLSILKSQFWDEVTDIITNIYNNRSKYTFIVDGNDFIHHIRPKVTDQLYQYIVELYAISKRILDINKELMKRIHYIEFDVDALITEDWAIEMKNLMDKRTRRAAPRVQPAAVEPQPPANVPMWYQQMFRMNNVAMPAVVPMALPAAVPRRQARAARVARPKPPRQLVNPLAQQDGG